MKRLAVRLGLEPATPLPALLTELWPAESEPRDPFGRTTPSGWFSQGLIPAVTPMLSIVAIFGLVETHEQWIGPLTLWPQVVILWVSLAGLALGVYALTGGLLPERRIRFDEGV